MKKLVLTITTFVLAFIGYTIYDFLNVALDELPTGELISTTPSPDEKYMAKAYLLNEGGAIGRFAIRVEIDYGNKKETIYWNYDERNANLQWLDKETLKINDHTLNIFTDTYHWKKDPEWENNRK